jgi:hypothetical protein
MRLSSIAPYALCISSVAALLVGCSDNPGTGIPTSSGSALRTHSTSNGKTFRYTGKPQVFQVPPNVDSITVAMTGASGEYCQTYGGRGGRVFAVIPVTPHQKLWVYVGGQGNRTSGGFNGGGNAGDSLYSGNPSSGGGGASDVRVAPGRESDRILVAAGGGGDGEPFGNTKRSDFGCAGYGGGLVGGAGVKGDNYYGAGGGGGAGGSQSAGGTGGEGGAPSSRYPGNPGQNGRLGIGGAGGQAAGGNSLGGGGGGGGYYGGGGGGSGEGGYSTDFGGGGGGGGGSSFAESKATQVRFWKNWKSAKGDGLVVFSW